MCRRQAHRRHADPIDAEAAVDTLHAPERLEEKARAREQDQRERDLGGDQHAARAAAAGGTALPSAFAQHVGHGGAGRLQRWQQTGEQRRDRRDGECEAEDARVEA